MPACKCFVIATIEDMERRVATVESALAEFERIIERLDFGIQALRVGADEESAMALADALEGL